MTGITLPPLIILSRYPLITPISQEAKDDTYEHTPVQDETVDREQVSPRNSSRPKNVAVHLKDNLSLLYSALVCVANKASAEDMQNALLDTNQTSIRLKLRNFLNGNETNSGPHIITEFRKNINDAVEESQYYALKNELFNYSDTSQNERLSSATDLSDQDIADAIGQLIDDMQKEFLNPFMSATQKMTLWYETLSKLNELVTQNTKPGKDPNEVEINAKALLEAMDKMMTAMGDLTLFEGKSPEEAQAWCEKMGVGKVVGNKVIIDTAGFESFKDMAKSLLGNSTDKKLSMTEWNNFKSSMDTFLQREQGRVNKIFSQLEYYNKLLTNVREVLSEFITKVTDTALRFVQI